MLFFCFFLFKQKTAYDMRISDWSSDVCSSDLLPVIIVAHSADAASAVAALNAGADDHILLPCAPPVLAARIERQLDRAREAATLRQAVGALDARLVRRTLELEELQTRIEALLAEKAALNARLASRERTPDRSEEHTSALQSLMRTVYAVF